ncbi:MAG TPA: sigma-70 family RNA polymerase sigma factor [Planctomycetota bacterium]|nr:sigma-70 family RNA polymerase sigma factor [Planctomycetota bacterium]
MDPSHPSEPGPRPDAQALLAHAGWMRSLAFSLLGDSAAADDVVQDASLALLRAPPARGVVLEAWLSRLVRNFAFRRRRTEARRADHEALATPPSHQPPPAETLSRLELQRALLDAVQSLDEPYRTAVVQRYFEGQTSAAIAQAQGLPAGTVRWRLKQGVDQLRERLDAQFHSRASWSVLLAPFAFPPGASLSGPGALSGAPSASSATPILPGALAVSTSQVSLTAAAVAIAAVVVWWSISGAPNSNPPGPGRVALAQPPAQIPEPIASPAKSEPDAQTSVDRDSQRNAVAAPVAEKPPEQPAAAVSELKGSVDARFIDENGAPWSGVSLSARPVRWLSTWTPGEPVQSGLDGRATLELALPSLSFNSSMKGELHVDLVASRAGCASVARSATLQAGKIVHLGDVVLAPGVSIGGKVVDQNGVGIAGATVGVAAAELTDKEGYMRRKGSEAFERATSVKTGDGGAFVISGLALGPHRLWAHAEGSRYSWTEPFTAALDAELHDIQLVLTPLLATDRIAGRVVDPEGAPMAGAQLRYAIHAQEHAHATSMVTNEKGAFELVIEYDDTTADFTALDNDERFGPTTVNGVTPGTLDLVIRLSTKRLVSVHLRDKDGVGVDAATLDVEQRGFSAPVTANVLAKGDYEIPVPEDAFNLTIEAPGFRSELRPRLVGATMPAVLEIVMRRAPQVHGRVLADGAPLAGVLVRFARDDSDATDTIDGFRYRYLAREHWGPSTKSDAQGRFQLSCDVDGKFWLRAIADGWAPAELGPIDVAELSPEVDLDIALTRGGAIEGRVLLPDGQDGEGAIVAINHGDGEPRTRRAGANGFFRFEGLTPGKWQVLARDVELDPSRHTFESTKDSKPIEWTCEVSAGRTTRHDLDLTHK